MKIHTRAVHAGDRKKPGSHIPVATPITTAVSYAHDSTEQLDRIFAQEEAGFCYSRYGNPTGAALEELMTELESGHGAVACASGMAALQLAVLTALADRRKSVLAADALYGATYKLLLNVLEPLGVESNLVDVCELDAVEKALAQYRPGCVLMETISNPLLRVGPLDRVAQLARPAGAALIVDNTFATPLLARPLEMGASIVVHSLTKYLAGHGDVLGGMAVSGQEHYASMTELSRACGPLLGPFESYLTMRGVKTFPLRMERQCANARRVAAWLRAHPRVERVFFPDDPRHPDAGTIRRLFPEDLYGAIVSFEISGAEREDIFKFMDRLKLIVRATSLGDVHTMILYPVMSSHRDVAPKQLARMGIRNNLLRISVGIEEADDIIADLDQAF